MRIRHWAGYGCVTAQKVNDGDPFITLHIRVLGNHERGVVREDEYDLYNWLVRRFDHNVPDYVEWHRLGPTIEVRPGFTKSTNRGVIETCDYYFTY